MPRMTGTDKKHPSMPEYITNETESDEILTRPSAALVGFIKTVSSPLVILGAGGKMGPTLAVMARRAADTAGHPLEVIAASRFSDPGASSWLEKNGVNTVRCDLLQRDALKVLPDSQNVIHMVGMKFGASKTPATMWAINVAVPLRVAERYRGARIVALSTGNVYPLTKVIGGGSVENDPLIPLGEYANAAVGRERVFEYFAQRENISLALLRLFYAVEFRYGVLVDLAQKIYAGTPISVESGYFNCIWQADANEMILRSLALAAPGGSAWNLCRPEIFSVRTVAGQLGELLDRVPQFVGVESSTALLGNSKAICTRLGDPATPLTTMLKWIAHWVKQGGCNLGKPTHFEVRDGQY
jgi:hypothetical protein